MGRAEARTGARTRARTEARAFPERPRGQKRLPDPTETEGESHMEEVRPALPESLSNLRAQGRRTAGEEAEQAPLSANPLKPCAISGGGRHPAT